MKTLTYLAIPYSHPDASVRRKRFEIANRASAWLMAKGIHVFSPISHTHPIAECGDLPRGWDYWQEYDRAILSQCKDLFVLKVDGWEESKGVAGEIEIAKELGITITMLDAEQFIAPEIGTGTDPKGEVGKTKPQLHLIPKVSLEEQAKALQLGKEKYGERNWVQTKVYQSTYVRAMMSHIAAFQDGEDFDPESNASHLGHVMANCAIILDAKKCGTLVDDRVRPIESV